MLIGGLTAFQHGQPRSFENFIIFEIPLYFETTVIFPYPTMEFCMFQLIDMFYQS